jgi:low affinity Fe/Cu permease
MVFLIQNTQNRDTRAINLKLDEVIRAIGRARNEMIDIEHLSDEELQEIEARYQAFKAQHEAKTTASGESEKSANNKKPAA